MVCDEDKLPIGNKQKNITINILMDFRQNHNDINVVVNEIRRKHGEN